MDRKPGWKTSEFWVTIGTLGALLAAPYTNATPDSVLTAGSAAVAAVYAVVRLFLKK